MMKRRNFLSSAAVAGTAIGLLGTGCDVPDVVPEPNEPHMRGNIHHSMCRWTFQSTPLPDLLSSIKEMGIMAIDLIGEKEWPVLKEYGIHCSMCNGAEISLTEGWNDPQYHDQLIENYTEQIPKVAAAGYTNLICFSGNRRGMDDVTGLRNCTEGLRQIMDVAAKHDVVIQMELFNSKVNHPDYMCDSSAWGVALCEAIGSDQFKLLYDIYHMQVQEGDIIDTIRKHHKYFGHYHTAGVPGRNEIDDRQELNYPAIMKAIVETGYEGYVAQEFIPVDDEPFESFESLRKSIEICDV